MREEIGLALDKVGREVLGSAAKIEITKDNTTIVGDGSTEEAVKQRVNQIKRQMEVRQCPLMQRGQGKEVCCV